MSNNIMSRRTGCEIVGGEKKKNQSNKNTEEKDRCKSMGEQPICSQDSNNQL